MKIDLFPSDATDADLQAYAAVAADFADAPLENADVGFLDWSELQSSRRALRNMRGELGEVQNPSAEQQRALKIAARVLQTINGELDRRSESGSREPRRTAGRNTSAEAGDDPRHPLARVAGDRPALSLVHGGGGGIGASRVLACFNGHDRGGFHDFGDFARAVATRDPRLFNAASGMQTGVASDGGAAVPVGFLRDLMAASLEQEAVRPRARVIPMPTGTVTLPRFDTTNRSTGVATLTGKPTAEGATAVAQKAKTTDIVLKATKLVCMVPCTDELIEDAGPTFGTLLSDFMAQAMAATVDDYLLLGTGVAQPVGVVNADCTVEVTKESGQAAATLLPANLAKMVARLAPASFGRSVWLAHSSVVAQLFTLTQTIKNIAGTENVGGFGPGWFTTAPDGTMQLLSRPLVVTDRLQPLGTSGDILLADLTQYIVGQVGEARLAVDRSVGFKEGETWFKLTLRLDGQPMHQAPITPRRGSDTLSPFVKLETRS